MSNQTREPYARRLRQQYIDARNLNARIEVHRRFSTNSYGWTRWLFDQMTLASGARVLELGCGTAVLWRANAARINASWRITLSDLSLGMLREAKVNLPDLKAQISFVRLDAQALPFAGGAFDAVVANHMLYHLEDRDRTICEARRVLSPGGVFCAATNGQMHMFELDRIIARFMDGRGIHDENAERFGLETGEAQIRRHFSTVEIRRYQDALVVTEAQPLIDYAASSIREMTEQNLAAMRIYVEAQLHDHGSIRISKDAGVFISQK